MGLVCRGILPKIVPSARKQVLSGSASNNKGGYAKGTTYGFARTSSLLQARIRKASESRGFAVSRLLTHWAEIVGADLAAMARPVDVKYGRQGIGATLRVLTTGPQAPLPPPQSDAAPPVAQENEPHYETLERS